MNDDDLSAARGILNALWISLAYVWGPAALAFYVAWRWLS